MTPWLLFQYCLAVAAGLGVLAVVVLLALFAVLIVLGWNKRPRPHPAASAQRTPPSGGSGVSGKAPATSIASPSPVASHKE